MDPPLKGATRPWLDPWAVGMGAPGKNGPAVQEIKVQVMFQTQQLRTFLVWKHLTRKLCWRSKQVILVITHARNNYIPYHPQEWEALQLDSLFQDHREQDTEHHEYWGEWITTDSLQTCWWTLALVLHEGLCVIQPEPVGWDKITTNQNGYE